MAVPAYNDIPYWWPRKEHTSGLTASAILGRANGLVVHWSTVQLGSEKTKFCHANPQLDHWCATEVGDIITSPELVRRLSSLKEQRICEFLRLYRIAGNFHHSIWYSRPARGCRQYRGHAPASARGRWGTSREQQPPRHHLPSQELQAPAHRWRWGFQPCSHTQTRYSARYGTGRYLITLR